MKMRWSCPKDAEAAAAMLTALGSYGVAVEDDAETGKMEIEIRAFLFRLGILICFE
ncbi:uncharacterized protein DS421_11g345970 [Arachis hypogaea]|nr:uncharacterized protein DS421_11g345970 [Arachis hypogaea]